MTGAILDLSPQLLLAALREIGMDLPIDAMVIGARMDTFRPGTVQLMLTGSGLPELAEAAEPPTINPAPVWLKDPLRCPECGGPAFDVDGDTYRNRLQT